MLIHLAFCELTGLLNRHYLRLGHETIAGQLLLIDDAEDPQLDAIRGIAVLLVIIHNTGSFPSLHLGAISAYGWMGVDIFFVLAGFLITGIMLDAKQADGYFKKFYARRCLRIWPLYYGLLLFVFVILPHLRPSDASIIFERSSP